MAESHLIPLMFIFTFCFISFFQKLCSLKRISYVLCINKKCLHPAGDTGIGIMWIEKNVSIFQGDPNIFELGGGST